MLINEVITEMSSAVRRKPTHPAYYNIGTGKLGYVLYQTGQGFFRPAEASKPTFDSEEDIKQNIKDFETQINQKIVWTNPEFMPQARAYGVAIVKNEKDQIHYIGKLLISNKGMVNSPTPHDSDDTSPVHFDNSAFLKIGYAYGQGKFLGNRNLAGLVKVAKDAKRTGDWSEYQSYISGRRRAEFKLEPTDVLTNIRDLTPQNIVVQVRTKFNTDAPALVAITETIAAGTAGPYDLPREVDTNPFLTKFCEILHPVALVSGAFSIGNLDFTNGKISYNDHKVGVGYDSKITLSDGRTFAISSKSGTGLGSSIETVKSALQNLSPDEQEQYATEIEFINLLLNSNIRPKPGKIGPLATGVKLGVISQSDAEYISKMEQMSNQQHKDRFGTPVQIPADAPESVVNLIRAVKPGIHGLHPFYSAVYTVMQQTIARLNQETRIPELLKKLYTRANGILISTILIGKTQFGFVLKNNSFKLDIAGCYMTDQVLKRVAIKIT